MGSGHLKGKCRISRFLPFEQASRRMTKCEITYRGVRNLTKTSNKTHRCLNFEVFGNMDSNGLMDK